MHILPAEMLVLQNDPHKSGVWIKLSALVLGFIVTALPSITLNYEEV
jgi:hypothetical protein